MFGCQKIMFSVIHSKSTNLIRNFFINDKTLRLKKILQTIGVLVRVRKLSEVFFENIIMENAFRRKCLVLFNNQCFFQLSQRIAYSLNITMANH